MRCITQKGPNHANRLSHCHSKRWMGVHGCAHSSFGMTPTFYIILGKSRCHTKRRMGAATRVHPSFGMTITQDVRDLFCITQSI